MCKWDHTLFLRSLPHESAWRCREIEAGLKKALADIQGSKGCISRRLIELRYQTDPNAITAHRTWPFQNFKWSVALLDCCDFFNQIFFVPQKASKNTSQIIEASHFTDGFWSSPWPSEDHLAIRNAGGGAASGSKYAVVSIFGGECWEDGKALKDDLRLYIHIFFSKGYQVIITLWVVDDCFLFYEIFCVDLIVKCSHCHYVFWSFESDSVFWRSSLRRSYSAPKMTGEQRREARWDSRHHILFAKDRFCWRSGNEKGHLV